MVACVVVKKSGNKIEILPNGVKVVDDSKVPFRRLFPTEKVRTQSGETVKPRQRFFLSTETVGEYHLLIDTSPDMIKRIVH